MSPDPPACLSCGTCCFSTLDRYVPVSGDDYARLGDAADELVAWIGNRAYLRLEDGHCAALAIDTTRQGSSIDTTRQGSSIDRAAARFVCTVYERRPEVCRALERGSPECKGELSVKRERPLALLRLRRGA